jgi:hypothetical protein
MLGVLASLPVFSACSNESQLPVPKTPHDQASDLLAELESSLLQGKEVRCSFHVTASGAVTADLKGTLAIVSEGTTTLSATGSFAGEEVVLQVIGQGGIMLCGNDAGNRPEPRPEGLEEALLVGLTRMGILHNLAMLSGGAAPDHAQGGVQDWVEVDAFYMDRSQASTIGFALTVAGEPSGSATLTFDEEGSPRIRRQRVAFPEGEMVVEERYFDFVIRS